MRPIIPTLAFAVVLLSAPAAAQVPVPDTAAGAVLETWLGAFNSGDRERVQAFVDSHGWPQSVDGMLDFGTQTGGFELLSIERSESRTIEFTVQEGASDRRAIGRLVVDAGDPPRVSDATFVVIPPGSEVLGFEIDETTRERVLGGVSEKLREHYVFAETAEEMAQAVDRRRSAGEYDGVTDGQELADLLTEHLQDVSQDLHLRVMFSPAAHPPPPANPQPNPEAREEYRRQMQRLNCGFEKVEILPGNIGYLKFDMFASPGVCGATATAAMNFLQHVDALIVDMRENGGGDPAMVAYVTTYLFDSPTHLNDLYNRAEDSTRQWWTLPHVPGERLSEQPVYVLTSDRTFSGGEEFTYNLQARGRATIVGETTGGGAHPVHGEWIDERFTIGVPFARAINPITKTNWEGTGVEPDVPVPAAEALDRALELIAEAQ